MNGTPEEVADVVRGEISKVMQTAKVEAVGAAVGALASDGQPLAAYRLLTRSGVSEGNAPAVLDDLGAGAEVLDLLLLPDLLDQGDQSERADDSE